MAAFFSQQFTTQPGGVTFWTFGFTTTVIRAGIEVFEEQTAVWRYRGQLSTFVSVLGGGDQIFPELSVGAVWYPKTVLFLPQPILMSSLLLRATRQIPGAITFRFFGDDLVN